MFGETIDYYLLKPLAHGRNRATEAELDEEATRSTFTVGQARAYFDRVNRFFDNRLPIDPDLGYLDIGCGMGRFAIGLACAGARDVTGVDILPRCIAEAQHIASTMEEDQARPTFISSDIHDMKTDRHYDVITVLGAMEHIHDPPKFLRRLVELLKRDGLAFVSHEPFQSPIGDHMYGFFRIQFPWRGLIFSEKAVLRLRSECYRPTDPAKRYPEVAGGLNLMSYSQYLERVQDAGLEFIFHSHNPQLWDSRRYIPFRFLSSVLTRIPKVRDYFIVNVFSIIRKRR